MIKLHKKFESSNLQNFNFPRIKDPSTILFDSRTTPFSFSIRTYIFGTIRYTPSAFYVSSRTNGQYIQQDTWGRGERRDFYCTYFILLGVQRRQIEKRNGIETRTVRFSGNMVKKKMVRCQPLILN